MKTVGLFALMLACGLPVPVDDRSSFCLFDQLLLDIGDEQSIEEDLSTFSSHVANLRTMLDLAGARSLVLIDEAGTGTDPAEGGALAQAVLEALHAAGARTIVTTHHGTLKAYAHETPGVENASMQFDQHTLGPTYRFQAGIPGSSYAFEVAARIGLGEPVLERARALVGRQKTAFEDLIAEFERRTVALQEQLAEAERQASEHRTARAVYEERNNRLRDQLDRIKADALAEADRIVQQANARVERTIREIKEAEAEREATRQARHALERFKTSVEKEKSRAERRLRTRPARKETKGGQPAPARDRPVEVGDQVVLDDADTAAEVLEIDGKQAVIATGTLRMRVDLDRITRIGGPRPQQVVVVQHEASASNIPAMRARQRIDVRGKRAAEALAEVDRFVSDGIAAGLTRLEIVHGKGTGALRTAIQEALNGHPDVLECSDAPWDQGGPGVTLVRLV